MRPRKKDRERHIIQSVYDERRFEAVDASERPDFVIRRKHNQGQFGVEVTELFQSEANARATLIPDYVVALLNGERPRHKDDVKALKVEHVTLQDANGNLKEEDVPAIVSRQPTPDEFRRLLAETISTKGDQKERYGDNVEYVNLIIYDHVWLLVANAREDFTRLILDESLKKTIAASGFREIFLVTRINHKDVYVPLVMLTLLSEVYMFAEAMNETEFRNRLFDRRGSSELFAQYLRARGYAAMLRHDEGHVEVVLGNAGLLLQEDGGVAIRDYADHRLPPLDLPPGPTDPGWQLPPVVLLALERIRGERVFVSPLMYDVVNNSGS